MDKENFINLEEPKQKIGRKALESSRRFPAVVKDKSTKLISAPLSCPPENHKSPSQLKSEYENLSPVKIVSPGTKFRTPADNCKSTA